MFLRAVLRGLFVRVVVMVLAGVCFSGPIGAQLFTEEAASRGVDYSYFVSSTIGSGIGLNDLDGDGDLDLVLAGGQTIGIFENDGNGNFTDRSANYGPASTYSGVAAADFDADGDLDLYISAFGDPNLLLRNDGGFQFVDIASSLGEEMGEIRESGTFLVWWRMLPLLVEAVRRSWPLAAHLLT